MLGTLPKALEVGGKEYKIRSDFRVALLIFEAFNDPDLNDFEKVNVCLQCLFEDVPEDLENAYQKAVWFLNGGEEILEKYAEKRKVFDWEQDEKLIFSAINKTAGFEVRSQDYLHWWTFLGYFNEIGEGLFSTVLSIRLKKSKGKKLEKYEREFYMEHQDLINLKQRYTEEEQAEIDRLKSLMG